LNKIFWLLDVLIVIEVFFRPIRRTLDCSEAVSEDVRGRLEAERCPFSSLEDGRLRLRDPDGVVLFISRLNSDS
jgi:hypothetical protein